MFRGFLRSTNHSPPLRQEQAPSTTPLLCCHPAWRAPRVERSDGPAPILSERFRSCRKGPAPLHFRLSTSASAKEFGPRNHGHAVLYFLTSLPPYFVTSVHAGRITKTVRSRRLKDATNPSNCFHGKYFLLSNCIPRAASSPVTISARASTHSPSTLPRMSHGAILTRGLLRMRFTFPDTPMVYTYSFASFESRLADGSAANHTGVFTPSPLFLRVSRFKYLCLANAANPIASLLAVGCKVFYAGHKKWDRHSCLSHRDLRQVQVWVASSAFGSLPDVRHVFRKSIFLLFAECPSGLEMTVVDKRVHRVMHMTVIGALQIRDAHQIERDRLCLRRIRSAHRRLISRHAIVG